MEQAVRKQYIAIDLKSFYASVECVERHLDPMKTHLVVADASRTEKTICLAVSPSLKAYGIPGRVRLFEVVRKVREINRKRLSQAARTGKALRRKNENGTCEYAFSGSSFNADLLSSDPSLELEYITAVPRMALYMKYSTRIYQIYLKYVAPEDIHVYSIDEVLIDATPYLAMYHQTARELAAAMIRDVYVATGITATGGIGTNLYLCKVAMDIMAKHAPADENGVRLAELDEMSYRRELWAHMPITDFWRVGKGIAAKLEQHQMYTMGDIARCSLDKTGDAYGENLLFKLFGINAELLIDHAWGREPCTMSDIKSYKPADNSFSSGQVLKCPYSFEKGRIIAREMAERMALDLVEKGLVTDQVTLMIGYDAENMEKAHSYKGKVVRDFYGRTVPAQAHGSANLELDTSSGRIIAEKILALYDEITDRSLTLRRITVGVNHVVPEGTRTRRPVQLDMFGSMNGETGSARENGEVLEKEKALQKTAVSIQRKYGKNALLKATSLEEGSTAMERNGQVGGHKA